MKTGLGQLLLKRQASIKKRKKETKMKKRDKKRNRSTNFLFLREMKSP